MHAQYESDTSHAVQDQQESPRATSESEQLPSAEPSAARTDDDSDDDRPIANLRGKQPAHASPQRRAGKTPESTSVPKPSMDRLEHPTGTAAFPDSDDRSELPPSPSLFASRSHAVSGSSPASQSASQSVSADDSPAETAEDQHAATAHAHVPVSRATLAGSGPEVADSPTASVLGAALRIANEVVHVSPAPAAQAWQTTPDEPACSPAQNSQASSSGALDDGHIARAASVPAAHPQSLSAATPDGLPGDDAPAGMHQTEDTATHGRGSPQEAGQAAHQSPVNRVQPSSAGLGAHSPSPNSRQPPGEQPSLDASGPAVGPVEGLQQQMALQQASTVLLSAQPTLPPSPPGSEATAQPSAAPMLVEQEPDSEPVPAVIALLQPTAAAIASQALEPASLPGSTSPALQETHPSQPLPVTDAHLPVPADMQDPAAQCSDREDHAAGVTRSTAPGTLQQSMPPQQTRMAPAVQRSINAAAQHQGASPMAEEDCKMQIVLESPSHSDRRDSQMPGKIQALPPSEPEAAGAALQVTDTLQCRLSLLQFACQICCAFAEAVGMVASCSFACKSIDGACVRLSACMASAMLMMYSGTSHIQHQCSAGAQHMQPALLCMQDHASDAGAVTPAAAAAPSDAEDCHAEPCIEGSLTGASSLRLHLALLPAACWPALVFPVAFKPTNRHICLSLQLNFYLADDIQRSSHSFSNCCLLNHLSALGDCTLACSCSDTSGHTLTAAASCRRKGRSACKGKPQHSACGCPAVLCTGHHLLCAGAGAGNDNAAGCRAHCCDASTPP